MNHRVHAALYYVASDNFLLENFTMMMITFEAITSLCSVKSLISSQSQYRSSRYSSHHTSPLTRPNTEPFLGCHKANLSGSIALFANDGRTDGQWKQLSRAAGALRLSQLDALQCASPRQVALLTDSPGGTASPTHLIAPSPSRFGATLQ